MKKILPLIIISFIACFQIKAQSLAFPTAEGAGKFVTGGRGNVGTAPTVMIVTRLDDPTPITTLVSGTFRWACTNNSPTTANRIIVFRVSGTIRLNGALSLNRANTTIAGQTAPGEGICIADYPVTINADNMIIRYLRFRLGDKNQLVTTPAGCGIPTPNFNYSSSCYPTVNVSGNSDAFGDNGGGKNNIIIDHCSVSWSNDEAFTMYKGNNVTLQWNILSEPLNYSYHVEPGDTDYELHAYGGIWGGANTTAHHNLMAHCKGRMPRFDGIRNIASDKVDFRNNVIYNWGDYNTNGGEGGNYNVVNNYYKWGPNTNSVNTQTNNINKRNMVLNPYKKTSAPTIPYGNYYLTGNYCDNSSAVTSNNWLGVGYGQSLPTAGELAAMQLLAPVTFANTINTETALDAYNSVLANAGCKLPNRDTLDERIVNDVKNRTGRIIDVQGGFPNWTPYATSQTAWPTLASGTVQNDTDNDGLPNNWENARTLNTTTFIANGYNSTSGYSNIENYINGDTIVAVGQNNICIETKKIESNNSSNWLIFIDSTTSTYNSAFYNSAVDSNQIVAAILDNGNFGTFSASYFTTTTGRNLSGLPYCNRNITITPLNPSLITAPVTVRIYISNAEYLALKTADPTILSINDVTIIKTTDNTCQTNLATSYTQIVPTARAVFGTYQNGYYFEFQTSSFSTFYFVSKNNALVPIKLSAFDVTKTNATTASATWTTEQEIYSKNFELQRSSEGNYWKTIATVDAAGNSNTALNYTYNDEFIKPGTYYYKLKQNDINGAFTYSNIKKLDFNVKQFVEIYPNPVKDLMEVRLKKLGNYTLVLFDNMGKIILKNKLSSAATIDVKQLTSGVYIAKIFNSRETFTQKIIISK